MKTVALPHIPRTPREKSGTATYPTPLGSTLRENRGTATNPVLRLVASDHDPADDADEQEELIQAKRDD